MVDPAPGGVYYFWGMLDPDRWAPPVAIAHRGSRQHWPENTMAAFEAAIALGARHIETDVRVSSDGVVHCFHDVTVDRTTDGTGLLRDLTAAEIAQLDAGHRHATAEGHPFRKTGARVPTLEELLVSYPEVNVVVDVKEDDAVVPLARLVEATGAADRLIVGGFSDARIAAFREVTGGAVPTSTGPAASRSWLLASRVGRGHRGPASALQLPLQMRGVRVVDQRLVDAAHERGVQVHVWTVNDPAQMQALFDMGVDGVVTDRIDLCLDLIS